jgi:hypothetical protein
MGKRDRFHATAIRMCLFAPEYIAISLVLGAHLGTQQGRCGARLINRQECHARRAVMLLPQL